MEMSMFEAGMIICFGASWPVAIWKTVKTKSVHGKSRMFLFLILGGYGLGIMHKVFYHYDGVIILYVFNFVMVLIETGLYFKYHKNPIPGISAAAEEAFSAADTLLAEPETDGTVASSGEP
jgi:hypothetical protein